MSARGLSRRAQPADKVGSHLPKHLVGNQSSMSPGCKDHYLLKKNEQNNELQTLSPNRNFSGYSQKKLQEENIKLKHELEDLRSLYEQLLEEGKTECFDERRVNLLKAQVMQLKRQVVLLTEGLSSRAGLLVELRNHLERLAEKLTFLLGGEDSLSEVPVSRADLIQMIEICQALKNQLERNHKAADMENIALPWMISGRNLVKQPVSLFDICYGKIENLNLHYVSALEGKLSKLLKHLLAMRQTLSFMLAPGQESCERARYILPTAVYARLMTHVTRCHQSLEECCNDLLILTLIVPSAPWARLENSLIQELTVENVLAALPAFPKGAPQQRAKRAAEALVKATNYSKLIAMQQIKALQAELDFHRSIYSLQVKYTEAVFEGIKQAYHTFQENVVTVLCSPLQDVLSSYINLKAEASEATLRDFLTVFKNNAEQIQDAVDTLTPSKNQHHDGDEALSRFGKEFFLSLEHSLKGCGEQRDKAAGEIEALQAELDQALENLRSLRKEWKEKKIEPGIHCAKSAGDSVEAAVASGFYRILKDKPRSDSTPLPIPQRKSLLPKSGSVVAEASINSASKLQQMSLEGSAFHHRRKSLHRSKSVKTTVRPPWQD
ncbi:uncharacterized protein LOC102560227 isoform X1 [Alligator mississippiensis]|uniref:Uncharacterized protein n=1 Tax=Alligator mississippiensis TaxID=8496 RepID=A0A151PI90_ALLMI|nr:uncharacterized protein LOC102560227 isoform X1 [Alligator mississippiensis]KYO48748.1 hypothetical protein Y1Q_0004123 [Alligator mississippiensis]